jgi:hypothetical protein
MTDQNYTTVTQPLINDFLSQLSETATIAVDPEHGTTGVHVDGIVDVNALVFHALTHAAHVIRVARKVSPLLGGATVPLYTHEIANMLDQQAQAVKH